MLRFDGEKGHAAGSYRRDYLPSVISGHLGA